MNYLLINGSARRGNTWRVAERLKEEIQALSPDAAFREIHLSDAGLPFCAGCSLCFREGGERCPHRDAVQGVVGGIDWADGVVWATATYNMQPTALTKNLIDHLCFLLHRPRFFTKKAVALTTVGGFGGKSAVKYLSGFLRGIGFNRCDSLCLASHSWNDYRIDEKAARKCAKLARSFQAEAASGWLRPPTLLQLIPYNLFRGMSLRYVAGSPYETADGAHWTEPARAARAYDPRVPLPFYKKLFGNAFYALGKLGGRFVEVTYRKE